MRHWFAERVEVDEDDCSGPPHDRTVCLWAPYEEYECSVAVYEAKLAKHAGWYWKIDGPAAAPTRWRNPNIRSVRGTFMTGLLGERPVAGFPAEDSDVGLIVGLIWRRALRVYALEDGSGDVDSFEGLEQSVFAAPDAQTWWSLLEAVRADYMRRRPLSLKHAEAFWACAPFLMDLTEVIHTRASAQFVCEQLSAPRLAAVMQALRLAIELLPEVDHAPTTLLVEGWNGHGPLLREYPAVPAFTRVRRV